MKGECFMAKQFRYRSAITGQFVKKAYSDKNPKTTIREAIKKKPK